jgi:Mitochondrial ribosomal protein L37
MCDSACWSAVDLRSSQAVPVSCDAVESCHVLAGTSRSVGAHLHEGPIKVADGHVADAGDAMDPNVVTGANIYTKGEDPKIEDDSHYPDWLWTMLQPPKSTKQLHQQVELSGGYSALPPTDFFRLDKLERKAAIKANNFATKKR